MKKFISIFLAMILIFSTLACTTAFAVSEPWDEYSELEKEIICELGKMNQGKVVLTYFHQLSDTTALYSYFVSKDYEVPASYPEQTIIGNYKYYYNTESKVYYFANSKSYTLNAAYSSGMLSDEQLDEIAEILDFETVNDDDVFLKIREQIANESNNINPNDITFFDVKCLSNKDVLFGYRVEGMVAPCVMNEYFIGNYRYFVDCAAENFLYAKSEVNCIADAYNKGLIDKAELNKIAEFLNFEKIIAVDVLSEVKEAVAENSGDFTPDDIELFNIELLHNGDYLFAYKIKNIDLPVIELEYNIGKYRYYGNAWEERFIYSGSAVKNINEAYNNGEIDDDELDEIAQILSKYVNVYTKLPDVNGDGRIDINDVTIIQKQLAGIEDYATDSYDACVNRDCSYTIDDVTLIQKYVAGLGV